MVNITTTKMLKQPKKENSP